jgi:hypothetical protein
MLDEAGLHLLWIPKAPLKTYWELMGNIPTSWRIYLEAAGK